VFTKSNNQKDCPIPDSQIAPYLVDAAFSAEKREANIFGSL
jgi:hypothetical protein